MAVLRSVDGKFYEIPDKEVEKYLIPEDKVKEKLQAAGAPAMPPSEPPPSGPPGAGAATIVVQIYGATPMSGPGPSSAPPPEMQSGAAPEVQPYGWWNNWWHNRHGGWNNWWHNWHR